MDSGPPPRFRLGTPDELVRSTTYSGSYRRQGPGSPPSRTPIDTLQSAADVVLQKSLREGFGLTVTEAMWKAKPVVGGDTGGIRLQVVDHHTGFLVSTPEGAALRIRYLLHEQSKRVEMGQKARNFVRDNFLITRHLRDYLTVILGLMHGSEERIILA